jgi:hypothetical protein
VTVSKYMLLLASLSVCAGLLSTIPRPAEAAPLLTIRQAAAACPDFQSAKACRSVAQTFLSGRQLGNKTDAEISNLVLSISQAIEARKTSLAVCRDAVRGVRLLAEGVTNRETKRKIRSLANRLCANSQRVGRPDPFQVPQSIIGRPSIKRGAPGDNASGDNIGDDNAGGDNFGPVQPQ